MTSRRRPTPALPVLLAAVSLAVAALACSRPTGGSAGNTTIESSTTSGPGATPSTDGGPPAPSAVELPRPLKATWVHLFDDTLKTATGMERMLDRAESAGLNTVFVQVIRRHDAYYDSHVLPPTPDPAREPGFDVLGAAVEGGHRRGIQVHAWITVATAWHEEYRDLVLPEGHVTRDHGPGSDDSWMTVSRDGTVSREYFDVGLPELREHVAAVVDDIASRYEVDGVHLDYARYAGAEWGYHPRALDRFRAETGFAGTPAPTDAAWAAWRRAQSRAVVERAREALDTARPQALLSAAVIAQAAGPPAFSDGFAGTRAYRDYAQDWSTWAADGLLDLAVPMIYVREGVAEHAEWYRQWLGFAAALQQQPGGAEIAVGVGGWLNPVAAGVAQASEALERTAGVSVFSYQQDSNDAPQGSFLDALGGL